MKKLQQLYEGKTKKVYATDDPEKLIMAYKDDIITFNGLEKGSFAGKGIISNRMTNLLMKKLEKAGVPTHFLEQLSDCETMVRKVDIVPLEVIIRNVAAGIFARNYGVEEGIVFDEPTIEFAYKNNALGDPLLNTRYALAFKLVTEEELNLIEKYAFQVNKVLSEFWGSFGITLVDFKLEFGRTSDGTIILADEISPDTCRLWDSKTGKTGQGALLQRSSRR